MIRYCPTNGPLDDTHPAHRCGNRIGPDRQETKPPLKTTTGSDTEKLTCDPLRNCGSASSKHLQNTKATGWASIQSALLGRESDMTRVRIDLFLSLDGYAATAEPTPESPMGEGSYVTARSSISIGRE